MIDLYRRRQIEAAYLDALARLPQPLAPSAEDCAAAVQALVDIDAVLNGLPPKAREALLLRKLDGMSYRDIATRLRVSVSSVESTWRPPCWPAARPGWRCPRLARHAILPTDPAIARRAAEWMARLWSDDASEQDRADCARWRAQHPDHERAWQTLLAFEDKLAGVQPQAGGHALRRAVSGTGRRRAMRLLGLGALLAGSGYALRGTDAWRGATADYHSGTGEIRALTLPDRTRLTLSTGTAIDLRFDANARLVLLLAGEILVATAPIPPQRRDRSGCAAGTAPCRRWARASRSGKTTRMRAWRCSRRG